jgi:hypothetical protein
MSELIRADEGKSTTAEQKSLGQSLSAPHSSVLARLIEEVRTEKAEGPNAYNRMHNRHNRSR